MIDTSKAILYIENSFLSPLLKKDTVTDISYNGKNIFYQDTVMGRRRSDIRVSSNDVSDFLRHLANISERQFSFIEPILEISIGKYRINALHHSLARKKGEDVQSFSFRIASEKIRISEDKNFMPIAVKELFQYLIDNNQSIIIAGLTGSGKTELQKYLLTLLKDFTRVIIIDNLLELDNVTYKDELDINIWQSNEKRNNSSLQNLIKNALRNNPDWLVVAESRGKEANDVLTSLLTGHPIITTIHAFDAKSIPNRFARMVMSDDKRSDYQQILEDVFYHLHFYVYVEKILSNDGKIIRRIKEIIYFNNLGEPTYIYKKEKEKDICTALFNENDISKQYKLSLPYFYKHFVRGQK